MYKGELIIRMTSPPDVCIRWIFNGGFNLEKRFNPKVDDLWQKITYPLSKDQVIDVDCKILKKNNTVVKGSVQYRDRRHENGVQIRCDNHHDLNLFHIDKLTGTNALDENTWRREWKRPVTECLPKSGLNKFRFALHKVLQYVEENYDSLIAPKFFFPYFGMKGFKVLKRFKPKNVSLSQYSEFIGIITACQIEGKQNLKLSDWIKKIVLPATNQIKKAVQEKTDIELKLDGALTLYPIPLFFLLGSEVEVSLWSPKQQTLNLKPVGISLNA
jgi:hypothetical protein